MEGSLAMKERKVGLVEGIGGAGPRPDICFQANLFPFLSLGFSFLQNEGLG